MKINPPQVSALQTISHIFNFTQMTRSFLPKRAELSPGISIQSAETQHGNFCCSRTGIPPIWVSHPALPLPAPHLKGNMRSRKDLDSTQCFHHCFHQQSKIHIIQASTKKINLISFLTSLRKLFLCLNSLSSGKNESYFQAECISPHVPMHIHITQLFARTESLLPSDSFRMHQYLSNKVAFPLG